MEPSEEMIDCHSAKRTLEMIFATLDFYFPASLRERFERVAASFEQKDQMHWIETARAKKGEIADAFRKLGQWSDMEDSELLMSSWDDEVFFFYVLRTQFVFSRIAAKPDDMIPGTLAGFWAWAMTPSEDEMWMIYPIFTEQNYQIAPIKPPIWKIPFPHNFPKRT
jgi:hypothetical protein